MTQDAPDGPATPSPAPASLSRRGLLTTAASATVAAGVATTVRAQAPRTPNGVAATGKRPNIVVIMGDDIGWMNVSSYGGDMMGVPTPNIDRIGREGLRLSACYAQPSCTAGRAAFITGQLPVRTGLTTVGTPGAPAGLKAEDITLAELLKSKGYSTAQFGKNHLGDLEEHMPHRHGFDEFFGNLYHLNANEDLEDSDRPTNPEFRKKFDPRGLVSGTAGGPTKDEGPLTTERMKTIDEEILAHSVDYLKRRAADKQPFFLWHATTRMHVFLHVKDSSRGKSRAGNQDIYGDALAEHDQQVGQLLKMIDDLGLTNDTIVVYTTDNGAYEYMWPEGGTSPFRGDKGTTWEGGVRVPCLVRWPGAPAGRVSGEIVSLEDFFPTFAAAAGEPDVVAKLAAGATYGGRTYKVHLDGYDQTALFTGKTDVSARKELFYYDEAVLTAVRYEQFKVVFSEKQGGKWDDPLENLSRPRLTNLLMDPFERQDGDVNRQLNEHKGWALTPMVGVVEKHLATFQTFPPRQTGLSGNFGRTVEQMKLKLDLMQTKAD